jgi:hypothetical protein
MWWKLLANRTVRAVSSLGVLYELLYDTTSCVDFWGSQFLFSTVRALSLHINITIIRDFRLSQPCFWRFNTSGIWRRVAWWLVLDVSEDLNSCIYRVKQVKKILLGSSCRMHATCLRNAGTTDPTTRRHIPEVLNPRGHDVLQTKCNLQHATR